jgi:riboflavin kinase/FMN adenylyltransferase
MSIETHVLDFNQVVYDREVILEFMVRLRDERRFPGVQALIAQIQKDVENARHYFRWLDRKIPRYLSQKAGIPS